MNGYMLIIIEVLSCHFSEVLVKTFSLSDEGQEDIFIFTITRPLWKKEVLQKKKKNPTNSIHKQGDSDDYNFGTFDIFILLEIEFSSLFSISSLGFN